MNKKTQVQAIREVFQFGIGIVFLVSIFYFMYDYVIPQVETYALTLQITNIAEHVNFLVSELFKSSSQAIFSTLENTYLMPEKLGEYSYFVFFDNELLCCSIPDLNLEKCASTMVDSSFQGVFFSGGEIKIRIDCNETYSRVTIGN